MTLSYTTALEALQNGKGTAVQTKPEQTRIILRIPEIDAPLIKMPKDDADPLGIVSADQLTDQPMLGRRGPVEGHGIVFKNLAENNGAGLWQSVHTNGEGVLIFNNATPEQFSEMQQKIGQCLEADGDHLTLESLDAILRYATEIGLNDRYNSTAKAIITGYENVSFSDAEPLQMPIKKPTQTTALFIPAGESLKWNPNGATTEIYDNGSFLIVSKATKEGTPQELRHLNPDDAERKYQLSDGTAVKVTDTSTPNVKVFSERTSKMARGSEASLLPPPRA